MTDSADNFASLSLKDVAGNRFALLNKIQEQVCSAISALHSGKDLLSIKKNVQYILEQVNKNLDLIKASCKEEGTNRHLAGNGFYTLSAGWIMPGGGGEGYSWKFSARVCRPVLQILTLFQAKKCHFSHPYLDLVFNKLCHYYLN